jgi:hypothetical protein
MHLFIEEVDVIGEADDGYGKGHDSCENGMRAYTVINIGQGREDK